MFPDRRTPRRELSREEIEAIRSEILFEVMGRARRDAYMELLLGGSVDQEYDPSAVFGVFPVLSGDGKITTDLVDFTRDGAGQEDDYLRNVAELTLDGTSFATDSGIQPVEGMNINSQTFAMMIILAESISPSSVLVFCGDRPETASAHLFYPIYLPPSEALTQVKDNSAFALTQH